MILYFTFVVYIPQIKIFLPLYSRPSCQIFSFHDLLGVRSKMMKCLSPIAPALSMYSHVCRKPSSLFSSRLFLLIFNSMTTRLMRPFAVGKLPIPINTISQSPCRKGGHSFCLYSTRHSSNKNESICQSTVVGRSTRMF